MHIHTDNDNYIIPNRCMGKPQHQHLLPAETNLSAKKGSHPLQVCGRINQNISDIQNHHSIYIFTVNIAAVEWLI